MPDLDDEEFTAEELAEAEALARVLDGGSHGGEPEDALQAAALLQVALKPELSEQRFRELRAELPVPRVSAEKPAVSWLANAWLRWTWLVVPAALVLFVGVSQLGSQKVAELALDSSATQREQVSASDAQLPKPSMALLRAQALALQGQDSREYDKQMSAYRGQVLAVLEERAVRGGRF